MAKQCSTLVTLHPSLMKSKYLALLFTACATLFLGGCDSRTPTKEEIAARAPLKLTVLSETPTYAGYGFKSALDGNPNNNYVAGIDNEKQAVVELGLETPSVPAELLLMWNAPTHFAKKVQIFGLTGQGEKEVLIGDASVVSEPVTRIVLKSPSKLKAVRVVFSDFAGQPRILLKILELR